MGPEYEYILHYENKWNTHTFELYHNKPVTYKVGDEKFGGINYSSINGEISHWKRRFTIDDFMEKLHNDNQTKKIDYDFLNKKLDTLKTKINISINMQLLSEIEVLDKIQGQIPELQLFKLGLPYLKKAYPTPSPFFKYVNSN